MRLFRLTHAGQPESGGVLLASDVHLSPVTPFRLLVSLLSVFVAMPRNGSSRIIEIVLPRL
jgi:hypothetical protein